MTVTENQKDNLLEQIEKALLNVNPDKSCLDSRDRDAIERVLAEAYADLEKHAQDADVIESSVKETDNSTLVRTIRDRVVRMVWVKKLFPYRKEVCINPHERIYRGCSNKCKDYENCSARRRT